MFTVTKNEIGISVRSKCDEFSDHPVRDVLNSLFYDVYAESEEGTKKFDIDVLKRWACDPDPRPGAFSIGHEDFNMISQLVGFHDGREVGIIYAGNTYKVATDDENNDIEVGSGYMVFEVQKRLSMLFDALSSYMHASPVDHEILSYIEKAGQITLPNDDCSIAIFDANFVYAGMPKKYLEKKSGLHTLWVSKFSSKELKLHDNRILDLDDQLDMHAADNAIRRVCIAWAQPDTRFRCKNVRSFAGNPLFESKTLMLVLQFMSIKYTAKYAKIKRKGIVYTQPSKKAVKSKKAADDDSDDASKSKSKAKSKSHSDDEDGKVEQLSGYKCRWERVEAHVPHLHGDEVVFLHDLSSASVQFVLPYAELASYVEMGIEEWLSKPRYSTLCCSRLVHYIAYRGKIHMYSPGKTGIQKILPNPSAELYVHIRGLVQKLAM